MAIWKQASAVFLGGTEQIKRLTGKKVRTKSALMGIAVFDPLSNKPTTTDIAAGRVGFVANPHPNLSSLLVAFPKSASDTPTTLDALQKSRNFAVIVVNEPTFKMQFEIEA